MERVCAHATRPWLQHALGTPGADLCIHTLRAALHVPVLQALGTLASRHVELLRGYSSYLANILDHLEGFSNTQLQQVFSMFAALTARPPAAYAAAAAGASGSAAGGIVVAGMGGRLYNCLRYTTPSLLGWAGRRTPLPTVHWTGLVDMMVL